MILLAGASVITAFLLLSDPKVLYNRVGNMAQPGPRIQSLVAKIGPEIGAPSFEKELKVVQLSSFSLDVRESMFHYLVIE